MKENCVDEQRIFTPLLAIEEASRCLLCNEPPCSVACPAKTDPGKFIRSIRFRNLKGAVETIREENPLGSICAKVCPTEKYCEGSCSRCGIDRPIQIAKLQEYLMEYEQVSRMQILKKAVQNKSKIAIIGSGPAGLVAASRLALKGYQPTIFEKRAKVGGWLSYGIPDFRLSKDVVQREIDAIEKLGVTYITNCEFGKDETFESLQNKQFEAILLTTGYSEPRQLDLFRNYNNVYHAVEFLATVKNSQKEHISIAESVLIIGGGDVAMDVAMTAKMLGSKHVKLVAVEELEHFRASKKELDLARQHHISIIDGFKPTNYDGETATFESLVDTSTLTIAPQQIILAIGQTDYLLNQFEGLEKNREGNIKTNRYQTSIPHVFVAGDISGGDQTVVYAVKTGKEVAEAIDTYLGGSVGC